MNPSELLLQQKTFFLSGKTKSISWRIQQLKILRKLLIDNEQKIYDVLEKDLRKPAFEAYSAEIGYLLGEIKYHIRHLKKWAAPQKVRQHISAFPSKNRIYSEPYGVVLIIAPWNYPFLLSLGPLIGAISAGNCAVVKPAELSFHSSELIKEMIQQVFPGEFISVFTGGKDINLELLAERWDYIFFTGSTKLGKIAMKSASENLTPITLEMGGKSPCIVDEDSDIDLAAKKIAWGKFMNAGQTCIAPDYLFAHEKIKDKLISELRKWIKTFFGENPANSPDFGRIISTEAFRRIAAMMADGKIVSGGCVSKDDNYISPTIIDFADFDSAIMKEEIFGPLLPVFTFSDLNDVISFVNNREKPLALYYFSKNKEKYRKIVAQTSSGGVSINDTILHIANQKLPFGGVGKSGMGAYHGKSSFETFSHKKPVLIKHPFPDIPLRYPPYKNKIGLLKKVLNLIS